MKRLTILLITAILILGSSINAQPQKPLMIPGTGMVGPGANGRMQYGVQPQLRMQTFLNLTDEQIAKINDIRFTHQNKIIDLRAKILKNRLSARQMMVENKIDEDKLLSLTKENSDLRGQIATSRTNMWLDIYNLLDDTQKTKWSQMRSQFGFSRAGIRSGKMGRKGMRNSRMMNGTPGRMRNNW
jgi:Spy/CpxP family protein refolding chaperone